MKKWIAGALLLTATQLSATTVEVATGDWSAIPLLKSKAYNTISIEAIDRVHRSLASGKCSIPGQRKDRLNLNVPFLIQFGTDGSVERVVLRKLGCEPVESVLASVLLNQAQKGEYAGTGVNQAGWYRSELRISSS